mgnify:CR=1 FL=1
MDSDPSITGPLSTTVNLVTEFIWNDLSLYLPRDLQWDALALTLVMAVIIWVKRRGHGAKGADGKVRKTGLLQFLVPKDIYTHESAKVDVLLWITTRLSHPIWAIALLAVVGPATESGIIASLQWIFGSTPALQSNLPWMLLYSLVTLLCYDFSFFITHYAFHKIPALWVLHKVHHSAEVLTPLTRYREHFLAGPIWAFNTAVGYGVASGIFAYLFKGDITEATLLNIGFFSLLFGFTGSLRHYHVQMHYPVWLSKWLHSPVMHHVHHSYLEKHWDKNFSVITSLWDRLFDTLYIPEKDEHTPWGIGEKEQPHYRSFWQNCTSPFKDWYQMLNSRAPSKTDLQAESTPESNRSSTNT